MVLLGSRKEPSGVEVETAYPDGWLVGVGIQPLTHLRATLRRRLTEVQFRSQWA